METNNSNGVQAAIYVLILVPFASVQILAGEPKSVHVTFPALGLYRGISPANVLEKNQAKPLSVTTGDFNEDGVPDLAIGYEDNGRGIVAILTGKNPLLLKESESRFASTADVFELPEPADFLRADDFDSDGLIDIATAK